MPGRNESRMQIFNKMQLALPSHEQAKQDGRARALALKNKLAYQASIARQEARKDIREMEFDTYNFKYE